MRISAAALCALLAATLAGCAGQGATRPDAPAADAPKAAAAQQAVIDRAQKRWDLMLAGEFGQAWEYFSPGYRSTTPRDIWATNMQGRPVRWTGAKATAATCPEAESYCDVTVQVEYVVTSTLSQVGKIAAASPVFERWIRVGQAWYLVPAEVAQPN